MLYRRTKQAKKSLENCSGDLVVNTDIGLETKNFGINISNALKNSWSKTHSFATQTESEELSLTEKRVEYYDQVTILSRSIRFVYFIDGQVVEHVEDSIVQHVTSNVYSLDKLELEAKKYMKNTYGVENSTALEASFSIKVKLYEKWKSFVRGDILPNDAVYAGNTSKDGAVYVARFSNTPGKVTLKNGRIHEFCVKFFGCTSTGEILLTNRLWEWKEMREKWSIPKNAVKNGLNRWGHENFIGKTLEGEPGALYHLSNKMDVINCYHQVGESNGYILVYSEDV